MTIKYEINHSSNYNIYFHVSRGGDDLLNVAFYSNNECVFAKSHVTVDELDQCVFDYHPFAKKIQLLQIPNNEWWEDGCPKSELTREIKCH